MIDLASHLICCYLVRITDLCFSFYLFQVKIFLTTTDIRASTFASQSEPNKNKNATPLDADSGQNDSTEDTREVTVSDDDYSYDDSLSETDDEDNCDDDNDDAEVIDCRCIHSALQNTRL